MEWKEKKRISKGEADILISFGKGRAKTGKSLYFTFLKPSAFGECDRVTYAIEGDRLYFRFTVGKKYYKLQKCGSIQRVCVGITEAEERELQKFKGYHELDFDCDLCLDYVEVLG